MKDGALSPAERQTAIDHIRAGDAKFYELHAAVVMPDHAHLILKPNPTFDLARILKGLKGVSSRRINEHRGTRGTLWQDESYDRILRDEAEFIEKWNYILDNAATQGLVDRAEDYPFFSYVTDDELFACGEDRQECLSHHRSTCRGNFDV